jgi:hypothetical protein
MTFPGVLGFVSGSAVTAAIFLCIGAARFYQVMAVMLRTAKARQPFAGLRLTGRDGDVAIEIPSSDPRFPAYLRAVKAVQLGWAAHERHREAVAKEA